ncbi:MAG TPA: transposase [Polyangiaceae bacterium]|nr:transposase [Polyangiaceae bacterium]
MDALVTSHIVRTEVSNERKIAKVAAAAAAAGDTSGPEASFLSVVRSRCGHAVHVLDRFHVMQLMSKAIDQVRRDEVRRLRAKGKHAALTKTRWVLLKRKHNLTSKQRGRLRELLTWNLRTVRAYLLKEEFQHFWTYTTVWAGRRFLATWTRQALRTRIEPIKKFARTLRAHEP